MIGAVLNIILDPIFIFVFHWGVEGAAIATIISQLFGLLFNIAYLFRIPRLRLKKAARPSPKSVAMAIVIVAIGAIMFVAEKAAKGLGTSIIFGGIFGIIWTVLAFAFLKPLCLIFGKK